MQTEITVSRLIALTVDKQPAGHINVRALHRVWISLEGRPVEGTTISEVTIYGGPVLERSFAFGSIADLVTLRDAAIANQTIGTVSADGGEIVANAIARPAKGSVDAYTRVEITDAATGKTIIRALT